MINKAKSIIKMPVLKIIFTLAIPVIVANLFQSIYQMTDSFWVGRLGGAALASVSICAPIIFLAFSIGIGFAMAGSTFVAQYFGAKNNKMVSHSAAQTILMVVFLSFIFSILGLIFAPDILRFMGANSEIFSNALGFLRISFAAIIFNFFFFIFMSIMRGIGKPIIPVYVVIVTVILNFFLDPLFIFGYGRIPAMGPMGAAMATFITQALSAIIGMAILFGGKHGIHLKLADFIPDFKFIKKAFLIGLPSSIEQSARNFAMVFVISLFTGFGTVAVASYGAASNINQVIFMVGIGLAAANGTLVGQNIGAQNIKEAIRISKLSAILSFSILSFLSLIVFIFAYQFISFFIPNDPLVIDTGARFIRTAAIGFAFVGLQMSFANVFIAAGKTATTMFMTIFSQFFVLIPLAYFLSQKTILGMRGIWISFPITNVISATMAFALYKQGSWQRKKIIEEVIIEEGIY